MTGILTFYWADDYGAMLQAYALKTYLEMQGESVEVIPYAPLRLTARYWWLPVTFRDAAGRVKLHPSRSGWRRNRSLGSDFWERRHAMRMFRRQYLTEKPPKRSARRLSLGRYGCVFVGSDQVWNPVITAGLDGAYTGNIKRRGNCRLVSYAASFGTASLPEGDRAKFAKHVGASFASISVREESAIPFAEKLLHRPVTAALDPTLLLDRQMWEKLGNIPHEEGYILICCTENNEQMVEYAVMLAARMQKKIIQISMPVWGQRTEGIEFRCGCGPAEFIGYFQNAFCVLTNSFHGTVFSILLEKQFMVFRHSTVNARLADLMEKLGLAGRMKYGGEDMETRDIFIKIDWQDVQRRLEEERIRSREFIRKNLEGTGECPD